MINDKHFMVDIETVSLTPSWPAITSVAIASFEKDDVVRIEHVFRIPKDAARASRKAAEEPQTMVWRQNNKVEEAEALLPEVNYAAAADIFAALFKRYPNASWWAKSPQFDFAFLNDLLRVFTYTNVQFPYRKVMDMRTAENFAKAVLSSEDIELAVHNAQEYAQKHSRCPVPHSAEYDALYQLQLLVNYAGLSGLFDE